MGERCSTAPGASAREALHVGDGTSARIVHRAAAGSASSPSVRSTVVEPGASAPESIMVTHDWKQAFLAALTGTASLASQDRKAVVDSAAAIADLAVEEIDRRTKADLTPPTREEGVDGGHRRRGPEPAPHDEQG